MPTRGKTRQFVAVAILNPNYHEEVDVMDETALEGLIPYLISVPLSKLDELVDEHDMYHHLHDAEDYYEAYHAYFIDLFKRNNIRYKRLPSNCIGVFTPQ